MLDIKLTESDVNRIYNELNSVSDFDFTYYAFSFKARRASLYMNVNKIPSVDNFIYRLNQSDLFVSEFVKTMFIPQSEMFRDAELWNYLQEKILPKLLSKKEVTVHIPVCIGGEEFFSLMFFLGLFQSKHVTITVSYPLSIHESRIQNRVFTQKDLKACQKNIELLKVVLNPEDIFRGNTNQLKVSHLYRGKLLYDLNDIRQQQNVSEFDLVLFRNRLIYYTQDLQNEVVKKVSASLKKGGFLILGERETLGQFSGKFKRVQANLSVFKKRII